MKDKKLVKNIEKHVWKAFESGGIHRVLVAVSGGADSVALLCACAGIVCSHNLHVEAINCNFHLRGEESNRDSKFTTDLCHRLGVKLYRIDYDVDAYLTEHPGISIEMACRELRYSDFFRICREQSLERVAVAHNADDDIETMMLNMLRGSGNRGLKGMDRDNGKVIRPLIDITRADIEAYLSAIGQDFITDSSNLTSDYRRNFIRRDVVPLLESRWPGARKALSKTVSILKEESAIIEDFYRKQLQNLSPKKNTLNIYGKGITIGTILRFLEPYDGKGEIAEEIMEAVHKEFKDRSWKLSERYKAILERDRLVVTDSIAADAVPDFIWTQLAMNSDTMAEVKGNRNHKVAYLPSNPEAYIIRFPKMGDRMSPLGMRGSRLVSDIISDAKLTRSQKDQIRVIARKSDNEIIWVSGLKRSRHDLISENSRYFHKVEFIMTEPSTKP